MNVISFISAQINIALIFGHVLILLMLMYLLTASLTRARVALVIIVILGVILSLIPNKSGEIRSLDGRVTFWSIPSKARFMEWKLEKPGKLRLAKMDESLQQQLQRIWDIRDSIDDCRVWLLENDPEHHLFFAGVQEDTWYTVKNVSLMIVVLVIWTFTGTFAIRSNIPGANLRKVFILFVVSSLAAMLLVPFPLNKFNFFSYVIPDLIRNPGSKTRIPAFAGMTKCETNFLETALVLCPCNKVC